MSESNDIDSLVSQLQGINEIADNIDEVSTETNITKETLEQFIISQASQLVKNSNQTISLINRVVKAAPDAKEVIALAELTKATSSTLDILSKLVISENKNKTIKEVKQLEITTKSKPEEQKKLKYTREEIFKQIFQDGKTQDVEVINPQPAQQVENTD